MAPKINQKLKPKMDRLLASMFGGFCWLLEGKLGGKIEPRANTNRFKNASKKLWEKCVLEAAWEGPPWGVQWGAVGESMDGAWSGGVLGPPN